MDENGGVHAEDEEISREWNAFLARVDGEYNLRTRESQPILTWNSSNMPVSNEFQLPIPVDVEGTVIDYRFNTVDRDIEFYVLFTSFDGTSETTEEVRPPQRFASHLDPITGTFSVARPGRLTLVWSNHYSWFNQKILGYSVTLHVPSLLTQERARCDRARQALRSLSSAKGRLQDASAQNIQAQREVAATLQDLERQLAELQHKVDAERRAADGLRAEAQMLRSRTAMAKAQITALAFRVLSAQLLEKVLSFGGPADSWSAVCCDWRDALAKKKHLPRGRPSVEQI